MRTDARCDGCELPEASDEHYRLLWNERFYALQETATGSFMEIGACK
jgi:hypothetical protein